MKNYFISTLVTSRNLLKIFQNTSNTNFLDFLKYNFKKEFAIMAPKRKLNKV